MSARVRAASCFNAEHVHRRIGVDDQHAAAIGDLLERRMVSRIRWTLVRAASLAES